MALLLQHRLLRTNGMERPDRKTRETVTFMPKQRAAVEAVSFKPGEPVPESGVYCIEHNSHRLMHSITLGAGIRFPRCKRCGEAVRFTLLRKIKDGRAVPFRSTAILEEYPEQERYWRKAG